MSLIRPSVYRDNINSIIRSFERFGVVDTAFIAGRNYHVGQGGDEIDNVIGEGLLRGVQGVDWARAAQVSLYNARMRRSARYHTDGFFAVGDASPEPDNQRARSGSSTLAFAVNDFYAAQLARVAGRKALADQLDARSGNWKKIWNKDAQSDGYSGFLIPRYANGSFQALDPKVGWDGKTYENVGFYEGTSWIYSYGALHDVAGIVQLMGGREAFVQRLEHALGAGLIDITNEPSFSTPWLFIEVGRPDLASYWANRIFERFTPNAYPGDEDNGAMSSHYVFNRIGLFPKLASDMYYLHAPHQRRAVLHLENGRSFEIRAKGTGVYIRAARLNGAPLDHAWLHQSEIMAGGVLELDLGAKPNDWGKGAALVEKP